MYFGWIYFWYICIYYISWFKLALWGTVKQPIPNSIYQTFFPTDSQWQFFIIILAAMQEEGRLKLFTKPVIADTSIHSRLFWMKRILNSKENVASFTYHYDLISTIQLSMSEKSKFQKNIKNANRLWSGPSGSSSKHPLQAPCCIYHAFGMKNVLLNLLSVLSQIH